MKDIVCIYHGNCADGFSAAWAVRKALGENNVEFYPGVYQENPPDVTGKKVIFVDFSYKRSVILKMAESAKSVLILDHHKSADEDLGDFPTPPHQGFIPESGVYSYFDMDRSGAVIAWEYFNNDPVPQLLLHVQDRDLWKFDLADTREIQAAIFSYEYTFENWDNLVSCDLFDLKSAGQAIERKHFKDINEFIKIAAYRKEIGGYDIPVLNCPYFWSSDAGHILSKGEPFAACYWDVPDGVVYSLRSSEEGLDVSEIAKQYGGGGHKHAAGFKVGSKDVL